MTKVKRKILMQDIDKGTLQMVDMKILQKNALCLNWVSTLMGSKSDKPQWKTLLNLIFTRKKLRHFEHTLLIDRPYWDAKTWAEFWRNILLTWLKLEIQRRNSNNLFLQNVL